MELLYLYNCAVLISCENSSILVDGLFNNNCFDEMPDECKTDILMKRPPFNNVTALLFTHCHADHFDALMQETYTKYYPETLVLSPNTIGKDKNGKIECGEFQIAFLETGHIQTGMEEGKHFVFQITIEGKKIVFTGDMHPDKLDEVIDSFGSDADAFFINPALLLYEMKCPENTALAEINNIYVYHIPSEEKDDFLYRKATININKKVKETLGDVKLLIGPMVELEVRI